ncbi:MarR family winged helix-turn-helix transcriptional regulator [Paenarthrobacter nitroguajacolicus]|uniref:MarR family winged helix-turn-helix transcriptional regulator n=1 Tax=Paenarthrobacter nitroguajacolicus TaxID=211146 RepID=UPI001414D7B2|nr:MarR family transcriptional regulator [Paenarthrobacter nitroguajacolicus]
MARRPQESVDLREVEISSAPLLHGKGVDFSVALQALVTAMNSTAVREGIMVRSGFPLSEDIPAFLLLNQLIYRTTARPTDMADAIGTGRSNVSKIVRRLEIAGLVGRMPDPEDGRQSVVGLTPAGREVAKRIVAVSSQAYEAIFQDWNDGDFELLETLVVRLVASIDDRLDHAIERTSGVQIPRPARPSTEHHAMAPHG